MPISTHLSFALGNTFKGLNPVTYSTVHCPMIGAQVQHYWYWKVSCALGWPLLKSPESREGQQMFFMYEYERGERTGTRKRKNHSQARNHRYWKNIVHNKILRILTSKSSRSTLPRPVELGLSNNTEKTVRFVTHCFVAAWSNPVINSWTFNKAHSSIFLSFLFITQLDKIYKEIPAEQGTG